MSDSFTTHEAPDRFAGTGTRAGAEPGLAQLLRVAPRLMTLSLDSASTFARQASEVLRPVLPDLSMARMTRTATSMMRRRSACGCEIPETECPPRCVCSIHWNLCHGDTATCSIRVVNTGRQARTFHLSATPLSGPGGTGPVTVTPEALNLQPGQSGTATASYTPGEGTRTGTYTGEILIRGAWEQCVRVTAAVTGRQEQHCHCEVEQGDPPTRIRAHHWYDHFQCEEPCFPTLRQQPPRDPQVAVPATPNPQVAVPATPPPQGPAQPAPQAPTG